MPETWKSALCSWLYPVYDTDWWQPDCPIGCIFAENILQLLGTDPDVMHLSLPYVQWMLAGSPLIFIYIIYTSILRGVGDSTTPLFASALTIGVGLVVTPVLIAGYFGFPKMGSSLQQLQPFWATWLFCYFSFSI